MCMTMRPGIIHLPLSIDDPGIDKSSADVHFSAMNITFAFANHIIALVIIISRWRDSLRMH